MRHHARQLRLALRGEEQPGVDADESARQGEGVDLSVANQEKIEFLARVRAARDEAIAQSGEVVRRFRIVVKAAVGADLAHDALAQPPLLQRGESRLSRVAELGQALGQHARDGQHQQEQKCAQRHDAMIIRMHRSSYSRSGSYSSGACARLAGLAT
ncbi:hypothetical protein D3C83_21290 [compost metagenome]